MRIVVRCQDARAARAAQALLASAKVEATAVPGGAAPYRPAPDGEDVVIVAALEGGLPQAAPLAQAARAHGCPPIAVLAGLAGEAPLPVGLDDVSPFTGSVALDAPPELLAAQIAAAIRASVTDEECTRRRATASALGAPIPKAAEARPLKALYIGAPSPLFLKLENTFGRHGGLVAAAFTSFTGFDHLHDEAFDAVVLNGVQDPLTAVSLCAALRRNASLYHLPTMVLTAPGDTATAKSAIDRGASTVATLNTPSTPSLGWLFEAIRRERRRRSAEHEMRALRDIMGDPRTGLFRRGPFEAHLDRMASDHHGSGRPMSLAALRVLPAHGASMPPDQVWRRGFTEIASLSGRLMRDADSGAALDGDLIVVALPASNVTSARRTAERIASVAECTAFASGESGAGPLVFEQSAVELQAGESGAGLLARALRLFELESATA